MEPSSGTHDVEGFNSPVGGEAQNRRNVNIGGKSHTAFHLNQLGNKLQLEKTVERLKSGTKEAFKLMERSGVTLNKAAGSIKDETSRFVSKIADSGLISRLWQSRRGGSSSGVREVAVIREPVLAPLLDISVRDVKDWSLDEIQTTRLKDSNDHFDIMIDRGQSRGEWQPAVRSLRRLTELSLSTLYTSLDKPVLLGRGCRFVESERYGIDHAQIHFDAERGAYYVEATKFDTSMTVNGEALTRENPRIYLKHNGTENVIVIGDVNTPLKIAIKNK